MYEERSCGAVIFTGSGEAVRYLLILQRNGIWSFPKGHMEPGETEVRTALREIREEVGLTLRLLHGFREEMCYPLSDSGRTKRVTYFLAAWDGSAVTLQEEEVAQARLVSRTEALELLPFANQRALLRKADAFLRRHT